MDSMQQWWESQDSSRVLCPAGLSQGQRMGTMRCSVCSSTQSMHQGSHVPKSVAPAQGKAGEGRGFRGPCKGDGSRGRTGKDRDVVLVGLVQRVVDDALFIWEAFEDVHTDLVGGEAQ